MVARKTPHRFRPKTPESASPPGEGEEGRLRRSVLDFGLAASPRQPPSPQPSPSMEREEEAGLLSASQWPGSGWWGPAWGGDPSPISAEDARVCLSPLERVKSGGPGGRCSTLAWLLHRGIHPHPNPLPQWRGRKNGVSQKEFDPGPSRVVAGVGARTSLTGLGRGRPNPGSSPGQVLPLPWERVKSAAPATSRPWYKGLRREVGRGSVAVGCALDRFVESPSICSAGSGRR